jgi:hypothetical protein
MKPLDVGIDAAAVMRVPGVCRVRAVFERALYVDVPGGMVVLTTPALPRGPLHVRLRRLPATSRGEAVRLDDGMLRVADCAVDLDAPLWSPELPSPASFATARAAARAWLPHAAPSLGVGVTAAGPLPAAVLAALRRGDLRSLGGLIGGRGPGLTPAGDDMLAGVLLVARALWGDVPAPRRLLDVVATNDIALAFLRCAARGRCIEPVHELLAALSRADRVAANSALAVLNLFGSSSGAALVFGIRVALVELPVARPPSMLSKAGSMVDDRVGY